MSAPHARTAAQPHLTLLLPNLCGRRHLEAGGCERTWDPLYGLAAPRVRPPLLLKLAVAIAERKERSAAMAVASDSLPSE